MAACFSPTSFKLRVRSRSTCPTSSARLGGYLDREANGASIPSGPGLGEDADSPPGPTVTVGDEVVFHYVMAIIGVSDLILRDLGAEDPLRTDIGQIKKCGLRAAALTAQMLAFSREQDIRLMEFDLNTLVGDLVAELTEEPANGVVLLTELEPDLERLRVDPRRLERVITTLAKNAFDAMPTGGTLTVKTENVTLDDEDCSLLPDARPGAFIRLAVVDTGAGMDQNVLQHIFEPFFTTKDVGEGFGLGLSMVYAIVKQHGGWITVSSRVGLGSTFAVYLPALTQDAEG